MAQIDETIVEHWLRRQGYSTVRGLTVRPKNPENKGQKELDLLAFRRGELVHVEVQSSPKPGNYLGELNSLEDSVRKYIQDKFDEESVQAIREEWCQHSGFEVGSLTKMVVYQNLKPKMVTKEEKREQLEVLEELVSPVSFAQIFRSLKSGKDLEGKDLKFKFKCDMDDLATLFLNTKIDEGEEGESPR